MSLRSARSAWTRPLVGIGAALLCLTFVGCAPNDSSDENSADPGGSDSTTAADACADPQTVEPDTLTIATDSPAFPPWFVDDDPTNGKGFESAVAYAVADEMGFTEDQVTWTKEPFNASYQPGSKDFDFDINQISITPKRAEAVTFSEGYYTASQAIITLKDSKYASATSLDDFADATLGAQVGTTSLDAADTVGSSDDVQVFDDTNVAKNALQNGQVDGIVADLPTAFFITAVEIPQGTIVGQFESSVDSDQFGLLFEKDNPLVDCADQALQTLKDNGTLDDLEQRWLSQVVDVPTLQ